MKICHITNEHRSDDPRIFHKMCTSLAKNAAYELSLIAPGKDRVENGVHIFGVGERRMTEKNTLPARIYRKSCEMAALDKRFLLSRIYKKALAVDAEVYHLHDLYLLPIGLKLKKKGYRVIFDSHEFYLLLAKAGNLYLLKNHGIIRAIIANRLFLAIAPYKRLLTRLHYKLFKSYHDKCCRMFDAIIGVSPGEVHEHFLSLNPRTYMIANYPLTKYAPVDGVRPDYASRKAVFAGGILPYWNHALVIGVIGSIPDARYILCGYSTDKYLGELKALSAWPCVDYRGRLPYPQIPAILNTAAAVGVAVHAYWPDTQWKYGSLGIIKLFEYMQAALPVVCTDFSLWQDIMAEYDCGICVNPDDADEVKEAIQRLLDHPDEAQRMGENGRRAVSERYNWECEEAKLIALYKSLE